MNELVGKHSLVLAAPMARASDPGCTVRSVPNTDRRPAIPQVVRVSSWSDHFGLFFVESTGMSRYH